MIEKNLNPFKKIQFEDLLEYVISNDKIINFSFLRENGFDPEDIDIIYRDNELDILRNNCRVLEKQLLKSKAKYYNDDIVPIIEKKKEPIFTEYEDCWKIKMFNKNGFINRTAYKKDIESLWNIIKKNKKMNYTEIVSEIIHKNKLFNITVDSFNGGKNSKLYFKLFYYPIKVLQHIGKVKYSQNKIERL